MKTLLIAVALLTSFVVTTRVLAEEEKPKAKLNLSKVAMAAAAAKKYQALVKNPESLKAIARVAARLKKK